jgi:hypothetical protein
VLSSNRLWGPNNYGVTKVASLAQHVEGNTGGFHLGHVWNQSTVISNGNLFNWSQKPYSLQRYPVSLNYPIWTRMPVVTAGTSPDAEGVSIDCRP